MNAHAMSGRNCFGQPRPGPGQLAVDDVAALLRNRGTQFEIYSTTGRPWLPKGSWTWTLPNYTFPSPPLIQSVVVRDDVSEVWAKIKGGPW